MGYIGGEFSSYPLRLFQFFHMTGNLPVLLIHPFQQWPQLFIDHIFQRLLQIKRINRFNKLFGLVIHIKKTQGQDQHHDQAQKRESWKP